MGLHSRRTIVFLSLLIVLGESISVYAQDLSGKIKIEPPYPVTKIIRVKKKVKDSCADQQISKSLLVSPEGGVANTVLWLEGDFKEPLNKNFSSPFATLNQINCNFEPHIVLLFPDSKLKILNSDSLAHDVRAFDQSSMVFRIDTPMHYKPEERSFDRPGIYTIRCGLHPWMHAFVVKTSHSYYAVSDEKGEFVLKNIPEGNYQLYLWHETLGTAKKSVDIKSATPPFLYTFKNPRKRRIVRE